MSLDAALADVRRRQSERRIARIAKSQRWAQFQLELAAGRNTIDVASGRAVIFRTFIERDELLRFVRSILANDFEGKECPGNCTHLDELGYEYDEPHLLKLDAGQVADIHLSIVDAAGDVLDELGLARSEA